MSRYWPEIIVSVLLACLTLGVYFQVSNHEFVNYDTLKYITENPPVRDGLSLDSIQWAFGFHAYASNWHPVTWLSHMLDCQIFGSDSPGAHHMVNVVLHIASAVVLFVLLRRMTRTYDRKSSQASGIAPAANGLGALRSRNLWQCAMVAALFALHPLHVESVAWAAERKDVLSGLFWMLTSLAYVEYAMRPWSWGRYLLVPFLLAIGLMAKPMLVTLPFALLLLDYWPLHRFEWAAWSNSAGRRQLGRLVAEKLPLFALVAISSVITYIVQDTGGAVRTLETVPFVDRLANSLMGYGLYLYQMVWPLNLCCFYPHPGTGLFSTPKFVGWISLSAVVLTVLTTASLLLARRKPYLLVGWLWYVGLLVPVIGLVQVGDAMISDRYTYIPLIGVFIMIVWGLSELFALLRVPGFVTATFGVVVVVAMTILAHRQVSYWQNNFTLFSHALEVDDNNYMAHASYGIGLINQGKMNEGIAACKKAVGIKMSSYNLHSLAWALDRAGEEHWDEAEIEYRKALEFNPKNWKAYGRLGFICNERGRPADAVKAYRKAIEFWPYRSEYPSRLALALEELGRVDEAISELRKATERIPDWAEAYASLGMLQVRNDRLEDGALSLQRAAELNPVSETIQLELAKALLKENRPKDGFRHLQLAVQINNQYAEAHAVLGDFFTAVRQPDDALNSFERAVELAPKIAEYRARLAITLLGLDETERAAKELEKAVEISPNSAVLHSDLSRVYLKLDRLDDTVAHLQRAVELKPESASIRIDLAGVCLRANRFEEGLKYAQSAIEQDPDRAAAHNVAGRLLNNMGRIEEAVEELEIAIEQEPDSDAFRANVALVLLSLGKSLEHEGRMAEGINAYRRGLSHKSDDVNLINNLAWILATVADDRLRDGAEAVRLAEPICISTEFRIVALIDTLAAAYAEAQRFDEAVETLEKAIKLADDAGQKEAVDEMREKLALYQAGRPYHEE